MDKVIISGACGFIGKSASLLFARNGIQTIAVDVFDRPPADFTAAGIEYCTCDIGDIGKLKSVIRQFGADTFLSLAWDGTEPSKRNNRSSQNKNVQNTTNSLIAAVEGGCKRFIGVGSAREREYEYALKTGLPLPPDCYGEAKFFSHTLCMRIAEVSGIECVWAVITNAYGPFCPENRFVPYLLDHFLSGRSPELTSCEQHYDLIYVEDVARALFLLAEKGISGKSYLIGSGGCHSLKDLVQEIAEVVGFSGNIHFGAKDFSGIYVPPAAFKTDEIEKDCGFIPSVSLAEGIAIEVMSMSEK